LISLLAIVYVVVGINNHLIRQLKREHDLTKQELRALVQQVHGNAKAIDIATEIIDRCADKFDSNQPRPGLTVRDGGIVYPESPGPKGGKQP
jgi:hypothetical protein